MLTFAETELEQNVGKWNLRSDEKALVCLISGIQYLEYRTLRWAKYAFGRSTTLFSLAVL